MDGRKFLANPQEAQAATTSMRFQENDVCGRKVIERRPDGPFPVRVILVDWRGAIIRLISASWGHDRQGCSTTDIFSSRSAGLDLLHALPVVHPILRSSCQSPRTFSLYAATFMHR